MTRSKKGRLGIGIALMVSFVAVLVVFFMPVFDGHNGLDYLDNLYNSISKGSAYYIPKVQHEVDERGSQAVTLKLTFADADAAGAVAPLFEAAGATTTVEAATLTVDGDLHALFTACLADADAAYHNRDSELEARYGKGARAVLHGWWKGLGGMERDLKRQKLFAAAELTHTVQAKAVECAYNYHGIEAQKIGDRWGIVLFSLIFYVIYTVWYGYAIMFVFEGLGFEFGSH
jgi:hypothetical protein